MRSDLRKLKEIYDAGGNVLSYIKEDMASEENSGLGIMISYDLQAGSYIEKAKKHEEFENMRTSEYAKILNKLGNFDSIIEIGVGEATTFANLLPRLNHKEYAAAGFDISYSRIQYAKQHVENVSLNNPELLVGDLFNAPILSGSIDVVYSNHSLEPNGGHEKEALIELHRITKKYLVLFEPIYEFADDEIKTRMEKHGYIKNLYTTAKSLGYNVIEYKIIIDRNITGTSNTGVIIIEKETCDASPVCGKTISLACPVTKEPLELVKNNYYCRNSMLLYPIVESIPCLLPNNAIIATHYLD
jgi:ubiquinone/menaquinone biosynthesis C-methylase UbiE